MISNIDWFIAVVVSAIILRHNEKVMPLRSGKFKYKTYQVAINTYYNSTIEQLIITWYYYV